MPDDQLKIEEMLIQIRNALGNHERQALPHKPPTRSSSKVDTQALIRESLSLLREKQTQNQLKPHVSEKIKAASQLLREQKSTLIKNYIHSKISSQIFAEEPQSKVSFEQLGFLKAQKERLLKKRRQEVEEERKNRERIIQSIQEQDYNRNARIPVLEIDRLIYEEQPDSSYLLALTPTQVQRVNSKYNEVKNFNLPLQQIYTLQKLSNEERSAKKVVSPLKKSQVVAENQQYQVNDSQQQSQNKYQELAPQEKAIGLRKLLIKNPRLVKIFYCFLESQAKIDALSGAFNFLPAVLKEEAQKQKLQNEQKQIYSWKNSPKKYKKPTQRASSTIQNLTQQYRFKGINIPQNNKIPMDSYNITERRISKMIGDSKSFHPKKCILSSTSLIYFEQQQKGQKIKKVDLPLQLVRVENALKEQGSFLSKKQQNIEIVNLKGKSRNLKFEKNFLEGHQIYESLVKLMAQKVYQLHCKTRGNYYPIQFDFIHNPAAKIFTFQQGFFLEPQSYDPQATFQVCFEALLNLLPFRSMVDSLYLFNSGLGSSQLSKVLNQARLFEKLREVDLSKTRVGKQNFQELCQLINLTGLPDLTLRMRDSKLDDENFFSNLGPFTTACSKIGHLDLSANNLTAKTIGVLKSCLENIICGILELTLDDCPLRDLSKLSALIRQSRKLEVISVQNCLLELDMKSTKQLEAFWMWARSGVNSLRVVRLGGNGKMHLTGYEMLATSWNSEALERVEVELATNVLNLQNEKKDPRSLLSGNIKVAMGGTNGGIK